MRPCLGPEYFVREADGILKCNFSQIAVFATVISRNSVVARYLPEQSVVQIE